VPGCKRSRFIEEEQFGVMAGRHHFPLSASELQYADDPPFQLPRSLDVAFVTVQDTTVSHERTPLWGSDNLTEWCDAILSWHV
jgi:hypothetical protein